MALRPGSVLCALLLAASVRATAGPLPEPVLAAPQRFLLLPAPPATAAPVALAGLEAARPESVLRLPGDSDSVLTLGGAAPSGRARLRLAVEVNEVVLKALAPDPKVEANDPKGRAGGDWKPIDAAGRPYQLRFGARLIW